MRTLCNFLSDPCLHLLGIALVLIYLTLGNSKYTRDLMAESPLPVCGTCHAHFLPGNPCECQSPKKFARFAP